MKKLVFILIILCITVTLKSQSKYSGRIDLGFGSDYNLMLYTSHGKLLSEHTFIGLGTGINAPLFNYNKNQQEASVLIFPLFLDIQYTPLKSVVSPVIATQIGGENTFITHWEEGEYNSAEKNYKLVGVISPSIGLRVRLIKKFALNLKFSMHFRTASTYNVSKRANSFSLGIAF